MQGCEILKHPRDPNGAIKQPLTCSRKAVAQLYLSEALRKPSGDCNNEAKTIENLRVCLRCYSPWSICTRGELSTAI